MSIKKYNGRTAKIFNRDIKKTGFVTFEDIENVAKTDEDNFFFYNNFFNFISVSNINGVARSTFLFFSGLTENIQEAFIGIRTMILGVKADIDVIKNQNTAIREELDITNNDLSVLSDNCLNISYLDGKTTINNNLKTLDIESNLIQSSNISSNTININKINTDKIYSNHLKTGKLYCFSLNSDFIEYKNDVGIHLYINNLHFPIMRSQNNFSLIYSEPITNLKLTIKPNYTLELYNSQGLLYQYTNTTDDFKYYLNIDKYNFTYLKIYLNYILLD
jgi:hypothetical protein